MFDAYEIGSVRISKRYNSPTETRNNCFLQKSKIKEGFRGQEDVEGNAQIFII